MKLFLCALVVFLYVGCESHQSQNDSDIQEQQENENQAPTATFPEKGGNAGNK